jgi:hypothetical protein
MVQIPGSRTQSVANILSGLTLGKLTKQHVKPYLNEGIFMALQDVGMFNSVRPFLGTIQWTNEADLCPDTVYLDSIKIDK